MGGVWAKDVLISDKKTAQRRLNFLMIFRLKVRFMKLVATKYTHLKPDNTVIGRCDIFHPMIKIHLSAVK